MVLKGEEGATPSAHEMARTGAVDRPCPRVKRRLDNLTDVVGHDLRSERVQTLPSPQYPRLGDSRRSRRSRQVTRTPGAIRAAAHDARSPT